MIDIKSKIVSEINRQLSLYEKQMDSRVNVGNKDAHRVSGAIHVLENLKIQVQSLHVEDYPAVLIVREDSRSRSIIGPASFLNAVLLEIKMTLQDRDSSDGDPGSGSNSGAMPGRGEVCRRIEKFVRGLDFKLKNNQRQNN